MNKIKQAMEDGVEEFYQHMLKSTPVLSTGERASLKLKFKSHQHTLIDAVVKGVENAKCCNLPDLNCDYCTAMRDIMNLLQDAKK